MKAFYDEALLKIAFKHFYDFQLVSIDWATLVFMQSSVHIVLADFMAYFVIVSI